MCDKMKKEYWFTVVAEAVVEYDVKVEATSKEEALDIYYNTVNVPVLKPNRITVEEWHDPILDEDILEEEIKDSIERNKDILDKLND
jgi:hypothetical protein